MTDRFPLIVDPSTQRVKELASGDNLDLTGSGIVADVFTVDTNSQERLRLDSSGRLLVGTSSAQGNYTLQIQGDGLGSTAAGSIYLRRGLNTSQIGGNVGAELGDIQFGANDGTISARIECLSDVAWSSTSDTPGRLVFFTTAPGESSPTERMRINSSGNVAVGTASINNKFVIASSGSNPAYFHSVNEVTGTSGNDGIVMGMGDASNAYIWNYESGSTIFATNATERMRIEVDGDIRFGGGSDYAWIRPYESSTGNLLIASNKGATGGANDSAIVFQPRGTEAMRIDREGRLGLGVLPTAYGGNSLEIHSESSVNSFLALTNSTTGTGVANGFNIIMSNSEARLFNREAGDMTFWTNSTERLKIDNAGAIFVGNSSSSFNIIANSNSAAAMHLSGGGGGSANIDLHGSTHSSDAKTITFDTNNSERMRITSLGDIRIGTTSQLDHANLTLNTYSTDNNGIYVNQRANGGFTGMIINRTTSDGDLISFVQAGTLEGVISVAGTTVTYGGGHLARWSQLPNNEDPSAILKGTVMSNLDEMCEWGEEDNEQLNKTKISDVEGDKNVAGVFVSVSPSEEGPLDFFVAMTGDMVIRIAAGTTVERGGLLMSAGDGTAKTQDDDIVRSKTIAKVTSTTVSETYSDGSYCVPCVLMAC